ncbi:epithelial cell transforming sequence 2 oncoprotein-like [Apophysomyces ossiformis]|uniref:Epithelial cell transforming sequence 2 oncoprotein-like n=1 Tax=Apophysomyces ossiformis TaxID=679940 RepID=A0A8H7BYQ8_9FUNG|nr:epithelial cell transforming sequence 2 oncoprotein-like [Apophysomyces ossiformis]
MQRLKQKISLLSPHDSADHRYEKLILPTKLLPNNDEISEEGEEDEDGEDEGRELENVRGRTRRRQCQWLWLHPQGAKYTSASIMAWPVDMPIERSRSRSSSINSAPTQPPVIRTNPGKEEKKAIPFRKKWLQGNGKRHSSSPPCRRSGRNVHEPMDPPDPPAQLSANLSWKEPTPSTHDTSPYRGGSQRWAGDSLPSDTAPEKNVQKTCDDLYMLSIGPNRVLRRRLSCPVLDASERSKGNDETVQDAVILNEKKGYKTIFGKKLSSAVSPMSTSTTVAATTENLTEQNVPPDVHHPTSKNPVLKFSQMKTRTQPLLRRTSLKRQAKALDVWRKALVDELEKEDAKKLDPSNMVTPEVISQEKREKYSLTRKFILREFYTTEITFWNQLLFIKVMFNDPFCQAVERGSLFIRTTDADKYANLYDLMQFSSRLIRRFQCRAECPNSLPESMMDADKDLMCASCYSEIPLGQIIRDMAEMLIVFLRCALDYKDNRRILDQSQDNKAYALYREKLEMRKETRHFTLYDYLIIPIQRVTRYELLLTDLEKHTEPTNNDYENIVIARKIISSLATAMNYSQNPKRSLQLHAATEAYVHV